jgi:hypothetical protein
MLALAGFVYGPRTLYAGVFICCVAAVIAAFTRITIAGLFIGSAGILFVALKGLPRFALPICGVIALPALFLMNERFRSRMFYGADSISFIGIMDDPSYALQHLHGSGRFAAWDQFLELFFEPSPFIGSGIGATQHYFYTHSIIGLGVIHSEYIRLLCEVGIVGISLFAIAVLAYGIRLFRAYHAAQEVEVRKYTLASIGTLLAYLVFLATDNGFDYVSQFAVYVFGLIAMSEKAKELQESSITQAVFTPSKPSNRLQASLPAVKYPILQE